MAGSIAANLKQVQDLYAKLKAHPMCLKVKDDGTTIVVSYPAGDWPGGINGIQCVYGIYKGQGKAWALDRLIKRMESDWLESIPGREKSDV